ncbi:HNH endonuclease signature motif containing protein [Bdellovibrio reynosensis]|uniref:HNH endonuclease n=1 Tax=Bdellovibrio reynosensis TaxID=2835041 RepID=A0ABY4CAU4_9BACT|nr:HNH endonuclease signature motif containing protein [Bdellovibrio reynosensis]UOF00806.1 HNH endonuclease [Bdellovibrio reynosensis]
MDSLSLLSNKELELRLKDLVQKERKLLHVILEHIREIDVRRLYLEKAYSSIYEYLTKELGYSGSAAMRRLEAARLLREVPQVADRIQEGSLNLSQIGELSRAIKEKEKVSGVKVSVLQKQELVDQVSGLTAGETQKEVTRVLDLPVKEFDTKKVQQDESVRLGITLSKEQYEKLLQCKDLAAHILLQDSGSVSLTDVIEFLADQYLDKKFKPGKKKKESVNLNTVAEESKDSRDAIVTTDAVVERKSVTTKLRRMVLQRDKCCQYVDLKTGRKCKSSFALQVDHKTSKWAGGVNSLANLQLLCSQHNREKYKKELNVRYR